MLTDLMTLEDWNSDAEESLSRIEEGTKFVGKIPGIDLETLTGEIQGFFNMGGFDIQAYKNSGRVFASAYSDYKDGLQKVLSDFRANIKSGLSLSSAKKIALDDFRDVCQKSYSAAYRAGAMRVGNPSDELGVSGQKIAKAATQTEAGFFADRLDSALNPGMDDVITGGYGDSLKSQFYNGMVSGADNNQQFIWRLGRVLTEHCPDCLSLSSGGPYTKVTLPTVPRGGDTECLWRCNCSLQPLGGTAASIGAALRPGEENLFVSVKGLDGSKVSLTTSKLFDDLYQQLNRARVELEFTLDTVERKAIVAKKTLLTQNVIDLADSLSVRVVPTWSVGDIKAVVSALKEKGYTLIKDVSQLSLKSKIWLLVGSGVKTGTVTSITRTGITLDIGGQSITYKSVEDFIGFAKD